MPVFVKLRREKDKDVSLDDDGASLNLNMNEIFSMNKGAPPWRQLVAMEIVVCA